MRVLIFGGTTEGRRLARALSAMGHQVWVSVATPLGAEELAGLEDVSVLVGRRSGGEMDALLSRGFHRCVDATHPYAQEVSRTIVNTIANVGGIICDGAKPSCAAKIASSVEAGILGYHMYQNGQQFRGGDGIISEGVENTIRNIGMLGHDGMRETDKEIVKIMMQKP